MTLVCYDAVNAANTPSGGDAYAGYTSGNWPNIGIVRALHPKAHIISIAVNAMHDADCLDVERGDATPDSAPAWVRRQAARGIQRPIVYCSQSVIPLVLSLCGANAIHRGDIRIWSAHYGPKHLCAPNVCSAATVVDGTQWASSPGNSPGPYDISLLADNFFGETPKPTPKPPPVEDDDMPVHLFHAPDGLSALAAVPGLAGPILVSSVAGAKAMYPGYLDCYPAPAEWTCLIAQYEKTSIRK